MLSSGIEKTDLFLDVSLLMSSLSLLPVEVNKIENKNSVSLIVILYKKESEINTEDLESAYNILYPRYSILFGQRDLVLEVSSPGLQRNIKDYYEFKVFTGRRIRLYSTQYSSYVSGIIYKSDGNILTLKDYLIEDQKINGEEIEIDFSTISKAKLDYKWEDKNDKSHK